MKFVFQSVLIASLFFVSQSFGASGPTVDEILKKQFSQPSGKPVVEIQNFNDLSTLIKSSGALSIDDLIDVLPEDYRGGYAMIYKTKALGRNLISQRRPRILLYGASGQFMMTYNSHPSGGRAQPGDVETLETLELDGDKAFLRELVFDGRKSPLSRQIEVNPAKCTQCHGKDPKGLWEPYNTWPGVYGSLSRGSVDFIKTGTLEHRGFLEFLEERKTNPRYSSLPLYTMTLEELDQRVKNLGLSILRPFVSGKMSEAITFTDGHSVFTNQRVGMILSQQNFKRLARKMMELPKPVREAYQYLVKGIALDEQGPEPTLGTFTNLYENKKFECLPKIDNFFPPAFFKDGQRRYEDFHHDLIEQMKLDYNSIKADVEAQNQGLSLISPGLDETDLFDQNFSGRELIYDSVFPPLFFQNRFNPPGKPFVGQGGTAIPYLFQVIGIPQLSYSTSPSGSRFNLYYGNHAGCLGPRGETPKGWGCFVEDIEAFVTLHVPKSFFTDPQIHKMNCDELAEKSRSAIAKLKK